MKFTRLVSKLLIASMLFSLWLGLSGCVVVDHHHDHDHDSDHHDDHHDLDHH
jgi:ABC-type nickel/cobalt efflux system permease component RcnA